MICSKKYFYRKVLYIFYDAPALSRLQRTHESSTNILRYCSVGYSVHHVRKKKNLFDRSAAHGTLRFSQFFKNAHEIKKLMTNNFLDVLVCSITEHFYSLFVF